MPTTDLNQYLAEEWIPALKLGAKINDDNIIGPIVDVEVGGVPVGEARTINFIGGSAVDQGDGVIDYTPPSGGSGTATAIQTLAADPGAPVNGDIWLNTTSNELKQRINGVTQVIYPQAGGTGTATDFQLLATDPLTPADGDVWYNTTENTFKFYQNGQILTLSTGLVREDQTGITGTAITLATTVQGSVFLFRNGLLLTDPGDYTIAGQNITLVTPATTTDTFTALIGSTDAAGSASVTNNNTFLGDNIFQGDTTFEGDVTIDSTSTATNVAGSTQVYNDGSIITNNSTETMGADYEAVYESGSTVNYEAGSTVTWEDEAIMNNQGDETFGAGYEGTYVGGSTVNVQSGASWDFNAGSTVDFTGATVTGLTVSGSFNKINTIGIPSGGPTCYSSGANLWASASVGTQDIYLYNPANGGYWAVQSTTGASGNLNKCASNGSNLIYVKNNSGVLATELFKVDSTTFACTQVSITAQGTAAETTYFLTDRNVYTFDTATGTIRVYALSGTTATFTMSLGTFGTSSSQNGFHVKSGALEKLYFVDSATSTVFKTINEDGTGLTTTTLPSSSFGGLSTPYYVYNGVSNIIYVNIGLAFIFAETNSLA